MAREAKRDQLVVPLPKEERWIKRPLKKLARKRFRGNVAALVREALFRYVGETDPEVKRKHQALTELRGDG